MVLNVPLAIFHLLECGVVATHGISGQLITVSGTLPYSIDSLYGRRIRKTHQRDLRPIKRNIVKLDFIATAHRDFNPGLNTLTKEERALPAAAIGKENITVIQQQQFCMMGAYILTVNANKRRFGSSDRYDSHMACILENNILILRHYDGRRRRLFLFFRFLTATSGLLIWQFIQLVFNLL